MARTALFALAVGIPSAVIVAGVLAQAQPQTPSQAPRPRPVTSAAGREQDQGMNTDKEVPYNPAQPQGTQYNSDVQVPIGQAPPRAPSQLPPNAGFNNPGGIVSAATAEQQAVGGVHYHYHYHSYGYGPGPGYTATTYENPATSSTPGNPFLTPVYGPGNPAPMNTLAGGGSDNTNAGRGGGIGAAAAAEVGGQAWSYGGGIGHWNPYAYGGAGYVEGFND